MKKIFALIVIISLFIGIIGCGTNIIEATIANNQIEKDRLEIIKKREY